MFSILHTTRVKNDMLELWARKRGFDPQGIKGLFLFHRTLIFLLSSILASITFTPFLFSESDPWVMPALSVIVTFLNFRIMCVTLGVFNPPYVRFMLDTYKLRKGLRLKRWSVLSEDEVVKTAMFVLVSVRQEMDADTHWQLVKAGTENPNLPTWSELNTMQLEIQVLLQWYGFNIDYSQIEDCPSETTLTLMIK